MPRTSKSVEPTKDQQTVTSTWEQLTQRIDGVELKSLVTLPDERGSICEIFRPDWGFSAEPLVHVYRIAIHPGVTKGWVVHRKQTDRMFLSTGKVQIVLHDDREDSPTYGLVNEIFLSEENRAIASWPAGVYHAVRNVGTTDAILINMPTRAYDYSDPDKYRLPLDTDLIPYTWT